MHGTYTVEGILSSLGFHDPMNAARQHARMILLGKLARYQATIQQFEAKWNCTLEVMAQHYNTPGQEDFAADDDYLEWQWYSDAVKTINEQIESLKKG
jgi:hypothetical protein